MEASTSTNACTSWTASSDFVDKVASWYQWFRHSFQHNLAQAQDKVLALQDGGLRDELGDEQARGKWQHLCYMRLRARLPNNLCIHIRRRLDRWQLQLFPGHRLVRALGLLRGLSKAAPPRLFAATLRVLCDGLLIRRRFQVKASCRFCGFGEDSIEHFALCPAISHFAQSIFNFKARAGFGLDFMLGLHCCWNETNQAVLVKLSVLHYSIHHAVDASNHADNAAYTPVLSAPTSSSSPSLAPPSWSLEALRQGVREAAGGSQYIESVVP